MTFPRCAATLTVLMVLSAASTTARAGDPCYALATQLTQAQADLTIAQGVLQQDEAAILDANSVEKRGSGGSRARPRAGGC